VPIPGFFGTDGRSVKDPFPQMFKIPQLRNLYQKVGMFGFPSIPAILPGNNGDQGDQVRGFGFFHDGSIDTDFRFVSAIFFTQAPGFNPIGWALITKGGCLIVFRFRPRPTRMAAFRVSLNPRLERYIASRSSRSTSLSKVTVVLTTAS